MSNMLFLYVYIIHDAYMYSSLYTCNCTLLYSSFFSENKKKINLKQKVSETTEECKRLKLRLHCARVEVDKTYKITLGGARTCSVVNIHVQLFVL